jgi:peptide/nickel transport system ATP-binding protein
MTEPSATTPGSRTEARTAVPNVGARRLEVSGLRIDIAGREAPIVQDVSFSLDGGKILGLVGESGSGKTTVALALLGFARPGARIVGGRVVLDGVNLLDLSPTELYGIRGRNVAYVPQDPASALNPARRVGVQLREALEVHPGVVDDIDERLSEILADARLAATPDLLRRFPHQLSGGQQQRVAIAMAFACRPAVIVLDEPTTGLDVTTQRHILETLRSMCDAHGVAAVHVSHDLATIQLMASQVAVMYAGRIIENGSVADVFTSPVHPYTRGLLEAVPSAERAEVLVGMEGQPPHPTRRPRGCSFAPRCPMRETACTASTPELEHVAGRLVRCRRAREMPLASSRTSRRSPWQPDSEDVLLAVRGLVASYGSEKVVHGISLAVPQGVCIGVVGESGSGKTTLARCIAGLHTSWTGEIEFRESPLPRGVRGRSRNLLRDIQFIFQNPYASLNPRKTIGHTLVQSVQRLSDLRPSQRQDRVLSAMSDVSLDVELLDRFPDELSGGERQRVAIARALVAEPSLLICDELTSALDVSVQAAIVELLRRLQRERNLSMIFITHNLALVRSIAQECAVLADGRIVEAGRVDEVLEHPSEAYTARLLSDVPRLSVTSG